MLFLFILLSFLSFSFAEKECYVQEREVVRAVYGSGQIRAKRYVLLRSGVSGYVKKILVKEGQRVKRGDKLVEIESSGLENRVNSLSVQIRELRDKLRRDSSLMRQLEGAVRIREENLRRAREKLKRREKLFAKGVIARESLEESQRVFRIAQEELRMAKARMEEVRREILSKIEVLSQEKEALVKELERYRLRSPMDGIVLKIFLQEGDFVNPIGGQNLIMSIGSEDKEVVLRVDEEFTPLLRAGQKVFFTSDAYPDRVFEGKVRSYELESDPSRRTVEVTVDAELPSDLPVNSLVEGNIVVDRTKTTVVPLEAVDNRTVILKVDGREEKVKVHRVFDSYAEVKGYPPGTPCLIKERR